MDTANDFTLNKTENTIIFQSFSFAEKQEIVLLVITIYLKKKCQADPDVIKLEFNLKLKTKHNDWLLADHCAIF